MREARLKFREDCKCYFPAMNDQDYVCILPLAESIFPDKPFHACRGTKASESEAFLKQKCLQFELDGIKKQEYLTGNKDYSKECFDDNIEHLTMCSTVDIGLEAPRLDCKHFESKALVRFEDPWVLIQKNHKIHTYEFFENSVKYHEVGIFEPASKPRSNTPHLKPDARHISFSVVIFLILLLAIFLFVILWLLRYCFRKRNRTNSDVKKISQGIDSKKGRSVDMGATSYKKLEISPTETAGNTSKNSRKRCIKKVHFQYGRSGTC